MLSFVITFANIQSKSIEKQVMKGGVNMGYTQVALEDKILDMYPEITKKGLSPRIRFDEEKDVWLVTLKKKTGKSLRPALIKKMLMPAWITHIANLSEQR